MKEKNILVTASDNIPYSDIEKQYGIVDSQIVVGANLFRDVFASFRDLFGGETKGYKKDINKMRNAAIASIKSQAKEKGANAVISLKIDLDELSGGGKSMFMMNIYGSAVKLKASALESDVNTDVINEFSIEDVSHFTEKRRLRTQVEDSENIFKEIDLDSISEYNLWNQHIASKVLTSALEASYEELQTLEDNLSSISSKILEVFLVDNFTKIQSSFWVYIHNSLESRNWFNYDFLSNHLKSDDHIRRFRALQLCTIEKDFYKNSELTKMRELGNFIINDLSKNIPTEIVTKMINKKEVYICAKCLREMDYKKSYCECGANKFGLKPAHLTPNHIGEKLNEFAKSIELAFKDLN